jgi:DNA mismatch repair protein MSH2
MVDSPIVMAVTSQLVAGCRVVGIAYIDAACRRLGAAQFEDDEQLCALERVLVQIGAKEVVIPQACSVYSGLIHRKIAMAALGLLSPTQV